MTNIAKEAKDLTARSLDAQALIHKLLDNQINPEQFKCEIERLYFNAIKIIRWQENENARRALENNPYAEVV